MGNASYYGVVHGRVTWLITHAQGRWLLRGSGGAIIEVLALVLPVGFYAYFQFRNLRIAPWVSDDEPIFMEPALELAEGRRPTHPSMGSHVPSLVVGHTTVLAATFRLFGVGLRQARAVSVVSGAGVVVLTYLLARVHLGRLAAITAAFLLATDGVFLAITRWVRSDSLSAMLGLGANLSAGDPAARGHRLFMSGWLATTASLMHPVGLWSMPAATSQLVGHSTTADLRTRIARLGVFSLGMAGPAMFMLTYLGRHWAAVRSLLSTYLQHAGSINERRYGGRPSSVRDMGEREFKKYLRRGVYGLRGVGASPAYWATLGLAACGFLHAVTRVGIARFQRRTDAGATGGALIAPTLSLLAFMVGVPNKTYAYEVHTLPWLAIWAGAGVLTVRDLLVHVVTRLRPEWSTGTLVKSTVSCIVAGVLAADVVESFRAYRRSMAIFEFNPNLLEELTRVASVIPSDCTIVGSGNFWLLALLKGRESSGRVRFRAIGNLLFNLLGSSPSQPSNISAGGELEVSTRWLAIVIDETHLLNRLSEYPDESPAFFAYLRRSAEQLTEYVSVQQGRVEVYLIETARALKWTPHATCGAR